MTPKQAEQLVELATDLGRRDPKIVAAVAAAVANPPRTSETVGYHLGGSENDFENCFRFLASQLAGERYASSAEDKYIYEIFFDWRERLGTLPASVIRMMPWLSGEEPSEGDNEADARQRLRDGFADATADLTAAFAALGTPLVTLDTGGGDTLLFLQVLPAVAERWRDTVLGHTHDGTELGVRSPRWDVFWQHLDYAMRLELGDCPAAVQLPAARSLTE